VITTRGAVITVAAGLRKNKNISFLNRLAHHLFAEFFTLSKSLIIVTKHVGFLCHACAHCKIFVTAAPRRARTLVSVFFSGLRLSSPLQIFGLVVLYTTNCLICRQLILQRRGFQKLASPSFSFL